MRRILIVDDSKFVRSVTRRLVEQLGFAVDEAADGEQAWQACQASRPPDAIILDIIMPVLDGFAFLRRLRSDPRFNDCIVVMCSTKNDPAEIEAAVAAGANEYIMKPFTDEILSDKLRQVGLLE